MFLMCLSRFTCPVLALESEQVKKKLNLTSELWESKAIDEGISKWIARMVLNWLEGQQTGPQWQAEGTLLISNCLSVSGTSCQSFYVK